VEDEAMNLDRVDTVIAGVDSVLHLPSGRVDKPAAERHYAVRDGVLVALDSPLLVIHGGAGVERAGMTPADEDAARKALEAALRAGHAQLTAGKPALEAVSAAITVLEDAPQFNAARGAVFTHDGKNELDASIMDGATGKAGAVAGVHRVKNPITLARAVMEKSRHVMMVGAGAEAFAKEQGVTLVDPSYFRTEKRWQQLQNALKEEKQAQASNMPLALPGKAYFGTVGALALDAKGQLAAGTSTGGMTNKRYGRVGDSPIIGAGTYARDGVCAISCTGMGEVFVRHVVAHELAARMRHGGATLEAASRALMEEELAGEDVGMGWVALDASGQVVAPFNTLGMARGWVDAEGRGWIGVHREMSCLGRL